MQTLEAPTANLIAAETPTVATQPAARKRITTLTALRFFGVFWVVIDHAQGAFGWLSRIWEGVALCQAVTFFFVLSGFVLAYSYFDLVQPKKILAFYVARVARLWPIHLLGALLLIALMPGIFKPTKDLMPMFLANVALVQSSIPILKYFYSYNAPSWSSSTLLFLYASFPLLLMLIRKSWLLLMSITTCGIIGAISLATYWNVPEAAPTTVSSLGLLYVSPIARLFDFSIGMSVALAYREFLSKKTPGLFLGTLMELGALGTIYYIAANSFRWRYELIDNIGPQASYWLQNCGFALVGCFILMAVYSMEAGLVSRLFRNKIFWFLGEISFCIYVLHSVFLVYGREILHMDESPMTFAIYLGTLLIAATAMWLGVEKPSRNLAKAFCKKYIYKTKETPASVSLLVQ